ncbi:hypothetical protein ESY86_15750 [Subsaximicrobium wynnwilliamsii]|uniref:Uncharacterized protein n=1 Tax=Subsaximicrobium wynnwilliamsii TaxID=291179 RepID=A0A5C6ZEZ6_9FLAO|nr:hypothetical protein ESY87_15340 [Subsaximicrobium wynnwilliamsii]TXD87764.1 hypothetical protein ESY86_15750 [Subsaximicrobium wynnwilliamsii]TXE01575.1 hypothetical protein ESY88_15330 [Subsaximicrobium wynnwilliamsii]
MKKTHKLSVFLLKPYVKKFKDAIKEEVRDYYEYKIKKQTEADGLIIIGSTRSNSPSWEQLLQQGVEKKIITLQNASNRAVLFFRVKERIFVITFGYGKHIIK